MDDEQLQNIALLIVNDAVDKAVDIVKSEIREMDEGLDDGVKNIVGLNIGRSINAICENQTSPTDNKMEGLSGKFENDVDDIVGLTIGRSVTAVRAGQTSPIDSKMEKMLGLDKTMVTPEGANDRTGDDKPTDLQKEHVTTADGHVNKTSRKKTVLGRLMDRILKRDKKEAKKSKDATSGGSTNASVGEKKKSASKAHNKRDWIRKNLLCCFNRQNATVEPLLE